MDFVRAAIAAYLIITLAATALAKLRNWRATSVSVTRESIIPSGAAPFVVFVVSAAELLLATFFMLGFAPKFSGFAAMGLFLAFFGYQLLVAAKTNSLMCSCAGVARTDPASAPAVAGTTLACLVQAGLSCTLALIGPATGALHLLVIAAWIIPAILFATGQLRRSGRPDASLQIAVWSPYRNYEFKELNNQDASAQTF